MATSRREITNRNTANNSHQWQSAEAKSRTANLQYHQQFAPVAISRRKITHRQSSIPPTLRTSGDQQTQNHALPIFSTTNNSHRWLPAGAHSHTAILQNSIFLVRYSIERTLDLTAGTSAASASCLFPFIIGTELLDQ